MTFLGRVRADWIAAGGGGVGLQWWTPGSLRRWMLEREQAPLKVWRREDLQLLLAMTAQALLAESAAAGRPPNPAAEAAWVAPGPLLAELDALDAAGWSTEGLPPQGGEDCWFQHPPLAAMTGGLDHPLLSLGRAFFHRLQAGGGCTAAQAERWLSGHFSASEAPGPPRAALGNVAIVGFSSVAVDRLPLLQAIAQRAQSVLLLTPEESSDALSEVWAATLEAVFGEPTPCLTRPPRNWGCAWAKTPESANTDPVGEAILAALETQETARLSPDFARPPTAPGRDPAASSGRAERPLVMAVAAKNSFTEARWLAAEALHRAQASAAQGAGPDGDSTDLDDHPAGIPAPVVAVVVPEEGSPLSRQVTACWERWGVDHFDAPGGAPGITPQQAAFRAWLGYQATGEDGPLLALLEVLAAAEPRWSRAATEWQRAIGRVTAQVLTGDLAVGWASLQAEGLSAWLPLRLPSTVLQPWPEKPTLAELGPSLRAVATPLGFQENLAEALQRLSILAALAPLPDRARLAAWLLDRMVGTVRRRAPSGSEPFCQLWLVSIKEAAGLDWDHLLLGGLATPGFPPKVPPSAWLDEETVAMLNAQATQPADHGGLERVFRPGLGWLRSPSQRERALAESYRQAIRQTESTVAAAYTVETPGLQGEATAPATLWENLAALAGAEQVLSVRPLPGEVGAALPVNPTPAGTAAETLSRIADLARRRRDRNLPFGEETFSTGGTSLSMACRAWESAWRNPPLAWFEHVLRVKPRPGPLEMGTHRLAHGTWLHAWMVPWEAPSADTPGTARPLPPPEIWKGLAERRAWATYQDAAAAYQSAGRPLPDTWIQHWRLCRNQVLDAIDSLASTFEGSWALAEIDLPTSRPEADGSDATRPAGTENPPTRPRRGFQEGPMSGTWGLTGRIDLVLLPDPTWPPERGPIRILDYKTGSATAITPGKLAKDGSGLQLALYACALASHFDNPAEAPISITVGLVLTKEAGKGPTLRSLGELLEATAFWDTLTEMQQHGTLGCLIREGSRPRNSRGLPLAVLPIPADLAAQRAALTFTADLSQNDSTSAADG